MVLGYDTFHGPKLEHVLDAAPGGLAPAVAVVAVVDVGADTRQPAPPRASADPWHHLGRVGWSISLLHVLCTDLARGMSITTNCTAND